MRAERRFEALAGADARVLETLADEILFEGAAATVTAGPESVSAPIRVPVPGSRDTTVALGHVALTRCTVLLGGTRGDGIRPGYDLVDADRLSMIADRREEVATLAHQDGIVLASHDDRTPEHIEQGFAVGARIAEFPLTMAAARRAKQLGMAVVLGARNAIRKCSTSSGNLLAADAVAAGVCDVLCSDYLPSSLQSAPHVLAREGSAPLSSAIDLVSANPATVLGLPPVAIHVGKPLTASLRRVQPAGNGSIGAGAHVGMALWRNGRLVFGRQSQAFRIVPAAV